VLRVKGELREELQMQQSTSTSDQLRFPLHALCEQPRSTSGQEELQERQRRWLPLALQRRLQLSSSCCTAMRVAPPHCASRPCTAQSPLRGLAFFRPADSLGSLDSRAMLLADDSDRLDSTRIELDTEETAAAAAAASSLFGTKSSLK
jgi:hypothetical protein